MIPARSVTPTDHTRGGRPRILDLFCGAGGCSVGYHRAGFEVVGVDIKPQPNYPFKFVQGDALGVLGDRADLADEGFTVIHASPPCQAHTGVPNKRADHYDVLEETRELLQATGLPWVLENVPGAPMPDAFLLCGSTFGLPIVRHRLFETSFPVGLVPSLCPQRSWDRAVEHPGCYPYAHGSWRDAWREHVLPTVWPWMTLEEAGQAIPPAYTRWIGERLREHLSASLIPPSPNPREAR
jgi:DNA (cytosine-5)-methyltransferase 1